MAGIGSLVTALVAIGVFLFWMALLCVVLWLAMRLVAAHERLASAQGRSAEALAEIARRLGERP